MSTEFSVNFFLRFTDGQFAYRPLNSVPRIGEKCVFADVRYKVSIVEWCLDLDATKDGRQRINIELEKDGP